MTRFSRLLLRIAPLLTFVAAAPAAAVDLGSGFSVGGGATLVSDYRFRGISQTDKRFAVQGTFTLSHSSGFYATWWGSSIDDYIASGSDAENDLILGYKKTFKSTTIDGGVLYYYYPGGCCGIPTDFAEPYREGHAGIRARHGDRDHRLCAQAKGAQHRQRQGRQSLSRRRPRLFHSEDSGRPDRALRSQLRTELSHHRQGIFRLEPGRDGHRQEPRRRPPIRRHQQVSLQSEGPQHRRCRASSASLGVSF